eukprot:3703245-Prorocentrum_lima.AAC.1
MDPCGNPSDLEGAAVPDPVLKEPSPLWWELHQEHQLGVVTAAEIRSNRLYSSVYAQPAELFKQ